MALQYSLIFFFSSISVLILCQFGIGRYWKLSIQTRKWQTFLLIIWFCSVFLGGASESLEEANRYRIARIVVLGVLFLVALLGIFRNRGCFKNAGSAVIWFMVYAIFGLISAIYAPDYKITLWKSFEVLVFVLLAVYSSKFITNYDDIRWFCDVVSIIMLYLCLSVFFSVLIAPSTAMPKMLTKGSMAFAAMGLFPQINANSATQYGAFSLALSFCLMVGRRRFDLISFLIFSVGCGALILGHSRTSIFSAILAVGVILIAGRHYILCSVLSLFVMVGAVLGLGDFTKAYLYRGQSEKVFTSMSGRTSFWESAWDVYIQSPIVGHGFYSQSAIMGISSVDNTYLQILLTMGAVGLLIILIPILKVTFQLITTRPKRKTPLLNKIIWLQLSCLYIIIIVRSLTGPTFQEFHSNLFLVLLLFVCVNTYRKLINSDLNGIKAKSA